MSDRSVTKHERVSDAELAASLKRYGNNKGGEMYRLLLELQERRNECTCPSGNGSLRWPCPVHPPSREANFTSNQRFDIQLVKADPISRTPENWRVTDTHSDSRVATCFDSDNARMVRDALNAHLGAGESDAQDAARWRKAEAAMCYSFDGENRTHYLKASGRESFRETIDKRPSADETSPELTRLRNECAFLGGKHAISTAGAFDWSSSACLAFKLACHRLDNPSPEETTVEVRAFGTSIDPPSQNGKAESK